MGNLVAVDMKKVKNMAYRNFWSLSQLAQKANISLATVFALQSKRRKASPRTVCKIAAALGVEPDDIVEKAE